MNLNLHRACFTCAIALCWILLGQLTGIRLAHSLENKFTSIFCMKPPYDQLCSTLPHDQTDFSSDFVYMLVEKGAQDPFDMFSWQSFLALNWPAKKNGQPQSDKIGMQPQDPRVWQFFSESQSVFNMNEQDAPCSEHENAGDNSIVVARELIQASGHTLIDSNLNYVVYDTRINPVIENYIKINALNTKTGQEQFKSAGNNVDFPMGYFDNNKTNSGGLPASISLKSSWMIIDNDMQDVSNHYYTVDGLISIPADKSTDGESRCIEAKLGMIGLHIVQRTRSGNGDEWLWSTFEHVDNAPTANNTRGINSIYSYDLFPGGCQAPDESADDFYNLFNAACKDCPTNAIELNEWKWALNPPYAKAYATNDRFGTQVVRCWDIFESTADVNRIWHEKLAGTVWTNYQLISTQWRGANIGILFEHGEVPRFLTNTSMETFVQYRKDGSCLGCHADAKTATGQDANFSFLLRNAQQHH